MSVPGKLGGTDPIVPWLNKLREAVMAATVNSVVNGRMSRGPGGTQIVCGGEGGNAGGTVTVEICLPDTGETVTYKLRGSVVE